MINYKNSFKCSICELDIEAYQVPLHEKDHEKWLIEFREQCSLKYNDPAIIQYQCEEFL